MKFNVKHAIKVAVSKIFNLHLSGADQGQINTLLALKYIKKSLSRDAVFVEVGAAAEATFSGMNTTLNLDPSNSHLIEACPENHAALSKKLPNSHCHNFAIAAEDGVISFYVHNEDSEAGSSRGNTLYRSAAIEKYGEGNFKEIQVPAKTLNTFLNEFKIENVGLMFMNCEGAEYDIFRGDVDFLDNIQFFCLDLHDGCKTFNDLNAEKLRLYDRMEQKGFVKLGGPDREALKSANYHVSFLWEKE